jgi:hypothetical protein
MSVFYRINPRGHSQIGHRITAPARLKRRVSSWEVAQTLHVVHLTVARQKQKRGDALRHHHAFSIVTSETISTS